MLKLYIHEVLAALNTLHQTRRCLTSMRNSQGSGLCRESFPGTLRPKYLQAFRRWRRRLSSLFSTAVRLWRLASWRSTCSNWKNVTGDLFTYDMTNQSIDSMGTQTRCDIYVGCIEIFGATLPMLIDQKWVKYHECNE